MKGKQIFIIILIIFIVSTGVSAFEDIPQIYISNMGFGHPINFMSREEKTVIELRKEVSKEDEYILHNDNIMRVIDGTVMSKVALNDNSELISNKDIFKKVSDRKWLKEILYEFKGIDEDIQEVVYVVDYFMNQKTGSVNYKEAWLFTETNVYIANMIFDNDKHENDLEYSVEVVDVKEYKEWIEMVVYKPVGKCYINDKCIAESIYFNKYEGTVPLRAVIENIGGTVEWNEDDFTACVNYKGKEYFLTYYFRGYQNGGISIKDNDEKYIALGRNSGIGKCFIQDGVTYMSRLTAERFFKNIGYSVEEIYNENECAVVLKNIKE